MIITNNLDIDIKALIEINGSRRGAGRQISENTYDDHLESGGGELEVFLGSVDRSIDGFKIILKMKYMPNEDGIKGVQVYPGKIRKIIQNDDRHRIPHHVAFKVKEDEAEYEYCAVIHYLLEEFDESCDFSSNDQKDHEDPEVQHPKEFPLIED